MESHSQKTDTCISGKQSCDSTKAQKGTKSVRVKKTKQQKESLRLLYRMYRGVQPGKEILEVISIPLGLSVVQI